MVTWLFENNHFINAWVPFDRVNQKKLEYVYRHHDELLHHYLNIQSNSSDGTSDSSSNDSNPTLQKESLPIDDNLLEPLPDIKDIDLDEEDASIQRSIQVDHSYIYINLKDSHFEQTVTLYPAMLLGSLPDRDILIIRMDHINKNKYLDLNL